MADVVLRTMRRYASGRPLPLLPAVVGEVERRAFPPSPKASADPP
jgi:hypothetical protein